MTIYAARPNCTLTIVRGLPSTGKSTYAHSLGVFHVEKDMFCMHDGEYHWVKEQVKWNEDLLFEFAEKSLELGFDCVVVGTFVKACDVQKFVTLASLIYNAKVKVVRTTTEYPDNNHNVPQDVIEKMRTEFEDFEGEELLNH